MKVLFLMDILEGYRAFPTLRHKYITYVTENSTGYVKIGNSVQSHAKIDSDVYTLLGGDGEHQELLSRFLDNHSDWTNVGMDLTAFYGCEKAVLFNTDSMNYDVWVPVD
jgi:hypothetical protein